MFFVFEGRAGKSLEHGYLNTYVIYYLNNNNEAKFKQI